MWCKIIASDLKIPLSARGYSEGRSMDSLKEDHQRFLTEGRGNIKKAKDYFNCIDDPFFAIPIDQVQ